MMRWGVRRCLQTQAVDEAIAERDATGAASSVPDPNPDPSPVGNGDLVADCEQPYMDVSDPEPEPTSRNACIWTQTDPLPTCTRRIQTKIKVRCIGEDVSRLVGS